MVAEGNPWVFDWLPPLLMLAGVVALGVIIALLMRGRRIGLIGWGSPATASPGMAPIIGLPTSDHEPVVRARQEIEDVRRRVGELIGTAQRLQSRMEEKGQRMQELLQLVDQRIASYELAWPESNDAPGTAIERKDVAVSVAAAAPVAASAVREIPARASAAQSVSASVSASAVAPAATTASPQPVSRPPASIATAGVSIDIEAKPVAAAAIAPRQSMRSMAQRIQELADRGLDSLTIARQLNEEVGKIELILALRHI